MNNTCAMTVPISLEEIIKIDIPLSVEYLPFPCTTLSASTEIFGSTKIDKRMVATPFIRPEAITVVPDLSGASKEA
ncbi:hypothetical protein DFO73_10698 [Cytobacillus oceanisediminis]|uniref:Uncharacterized protein n=1 Tax=Cytobacillus oceanisediminis TaxID=665099 RepID=A0A2V2ZV54_9BACI|nr:hypothetical protein DFO73_10698 [Cytobacillus oceanisediminis]